MTSADERFNKSAFFARIESIRDVIGSFDSGQIVAIQNFESDSITRLQGLLDRTVLAITSIDPNVVSKARIDHLSSILDSLKAEADVFVSDNNPSHFQRLFVDVPDELGDALQTWLHALPVEDDVSSVVSEYRRALSEEIDAMQHRLAEASDQLSSFGASLNEAQSQLGRDVSEESQRLQALVREQETRIEDLRKTIDEQRPRIDETIQRFDNEFRESEKNRESQANENRERSEAEIAKLIEATRKQSDEFVEGMAESLKRAQELVGTIAVTGSAASYLDWAKKQNLVANIWSIGTVVAGLVAGIVLLLDYQNKVSGTRSVVHLVAGLVLFGVAGYSGQQAALHRRREGSAANIALKLVAFPPFTEEMPQKDDIRKKFAESLFVGEDPIDVTEPSVTGAQISLFSQMIEVVKKIKG